LILFVASRRSLFREAYGKIYIVRQGFNVSRAKVHGILVS
jgi:hypothetical protein